MQVYTNREFKSILIHSLDFTALLMISRYEIEFNRHLYIIVYYFKDYEYYINKQLELL